MQNYDLNNYQDIFDLVDVKRSSNHILEFYSHMLSLGLMDSNIYNTHCEFIRSLKFLDMKVSTIIFDKLMIDLDHRFSVYKCNPGQVYSEANYAEVNYDWLHSKKIIEELIKNNLFK